MRDLADVVEDFKLNIDRVADERLWETLKMIAQELRKRRKQDYPKILVTPFVLIPHGMVARELIVDEANK